MKEFLVAFAIFSLTILSIIGLAYGTNPLNKKGGNDEN